MRFDKFTTKFQQAVSDAQSLAVGADNQYIESQHLLLALLNDADSGAGSLLARAGGNVHALKTALNDAVERLPKVEGHGGEVQVGRIASRAHRRERCKSRQHESTEPGALTERRERMASTERLHHPRTRHGHEARGERNLAGHDHRCNSF